MPSESIWHWYDENGTCLKFTFPINSNASESLINALLQGSSNNPTMTVQDEIVPVTTDVTNCTSIVTKSAPVNLSVSTSPSEVLGCSTNTSSLSVTPQLSSLSLDDHSERQLLDLPKLVTKTQQDRCVMKPISGQKLAVAIAFAIVLSFIAYLVYGFRPKLPRKQAKSGLLLPEKKETPLETSLPINDETHVSNEDYCKTVTEGNVLEDVAVDTNESDLSFSPPKIIVTTSPRTPPSVKWLQLKPEKIPVDLTEEIVSRSSDLRTPGPSRLSSWSGERAQTLSAAQGTACQPTLDGVFKVPLPPPPPKVSSRVGQLRLQAHQKDLGVSHVLTRRIICPSIRHSCYPLRCVYQRQVHRPMESQPVGTATAPAANHMHQPSTSSDSKVIPGCQRQTVIPVEHLPPKKRRSLAYKLRKAEGDAVTALMRLEDQNVDTSLQPPADSQDSSSNGSTQSPRKHRSISHRIRRAEEDAIQALLSLKEEFGGPISPIEPPAQLPPPKPVVSRQITPLPRNSTSVVGQPMHLTRDSSGKWVFKRSTEPRSLERNQGLSREGFR